MKASSMSSSNRARAPGRFSFAPSGRVEVLHLEGGVVVLLAVGVVEVIDVLADDQRSVLRAEETGAVGRGVEEAERRDADEAGQFGVGPFELLGEERSQGRVLDGPAGG